MCDIASRGAYDIFVQKDGASVCVGKYDNKGSFGELALMYNTPRAATIVATQEGALWALVSGDDGALLVSVRDYTWRRTTDELPFFFSQDRATFHRLIVKNNAKKRRMYEAFIESVSLLKSLEVCMNTNSAQSEYRASAYLAVFF